MIHGRILRMGWVVLGLQLTASVSWAAVIPLQGKKGEGPSVELVKSEGLDRVKRVGVQFQLKSLETQDLQVQGKPFQGVQVDDLALTSDVGMPRIPFYAVTVVAKPEEVKVRAELGDAVTVPSLRVAPAQPEDCRCDVPPKPFRFDAKQYARETGSYRIEYVGDFRGQPITRVLVYPSQYDAQAGVLRVYPQSRFQIEVPSTREINTDQVFRARRGGAYDYLVVAPKAFHQAIEPWKNWKSTQQGLRFKVVSPEEMGNSVAAFTQFFHNEYQNSKFVYALIVGSQKLFENHRVKTTSDKNTPSDLPYFTMGGAQDFIPDVFAGRIVAESAEQVERQLGKAIAYERSDFSSTQGWGRGLGVASNEGQNPSDNEYVLSIQHQFEARFKSQFEHFYQNDSKSAPTPFNQSMNQGAMWVTYMGHGSGTNWPSFRISYDAGTHIKQMANTDQVKPIWIDVACQNGILFPRYAGERLMNETDPKLQGLGTTAYYGGTVNISWHPPAILARGLAIKGLEMNQPVLGELLQVGHLYLVENYSGVDEHRSNQQWFHLQGDPSLRVRWQ